MAGVNDRETTYPLKVELGKSWDDIKNSKVAKISVASALILIFTLLFSMQIVFQMKTQRNSKIRLGDSTNFFTQSSKCHVQLHAEKIYGPYIFYHLTQGVGRLSWLQHSRGEDVSPEILIRRGYYGGTIVPNWPQVMPFDDRRAAAGDNIITFFFNATQNCISEFVHIEIPKNITSCIYDEIRLDTVTDKGDGCAFFEGDFRGRGELYGIVRLQEQDIPDRLTMVQEGVFIGRFENEQFSSMFCNLDENREYMAYFMSLDGPCMSAIKEYPFISNNFTDEAKWAILYQRLEVPKTKQTGVNYRRWGGITKDDVIVNDQLVTTGGVLLPVVNPQSETNDDDSNEEASVKWRKVKRRKNGKVIIRFLVLGKGEVYLYYEEGASKGKKMTIDQVLTQGKNIGFADDELVSLNLSNPPTTAFTIYIVIVQNKKQSGPFDVSITEA
ncbi:hypothetical protein WA158_000112 [Blastocystis sp. Blastoise]